MSPTGSHRAHRAHRAAGGRAAVRRAARRGDRAEPVRRLLPQAMAGPMRRLLPQAMVVAALAGGTSAFVAQDKAVRLSVDGDARTLHTYADDVGELLADEHVHVGEHDIVAPAPGEPLASGDEVAVRYGRPVTLTLDGERRRVWTTAHTVDGALRQLGVRAEGAYLSASRSAAITRRGLLLHVRTERTVTFLADGRPHTVHTNAATVGEALAAAGLTLRGQDTMSVPRDSFPRDGQTVKVMRITGGRKVHDEPVPFITVRHADPTLPKGTETVARPGAPGTLRTTYRVRTVNGVRQRPKKIHSELVKAPVARIVRVGTMNPPATTGGPADGLNWRAMARCESGGRPDAVDSSGRHGGLYQLDQGTWHALGGHGRPQDAPPAEQTYRAKKLYQQRGTGPWPTCGRKLHQ
ncbi:ubiquitin-like domain-containing protein [Streptomyces luomodiensis]|uniref:Ubiquitin-like domain-containing protein n=1 Tax=Streptomyces luomodiensis TaxID=3026192 RepID=A0ABY9V6W1_9ACTN|nr:ubiquitin-like domain-containing protein [Streptomyces sp. SCA4-21]WNE98455.1 ubiquitin-like domain-containing protein [Streptomyces sp. SCA4-21]